MRALAVSSIGLVASCGGGGGSAGQPYVFTGDGSARTDVLFGYYGENASAVTETSAHANLAWAADFYGPLEQMAALTQAKGLGMKAVLMIPTYQPDGTPLPASELRFWLQRLATVGLLWDGIVALYPIDEPQLDADVIRAQNAVLRSVMAEFPAIAGAKLAVIYACKAGFPGADAYDVIGCDDYDSGAAVVSRYYGELQAANPKARTMVVAAGADPWRLDPHALADTVNADRNVWAMVGFIWQTTTDRGNTFRGIRENGMKPAWCTAAERFTQAKAKCDA
jgi:hypothetical protein